MKFSCLSLLVIFAFCLMAKGETVIHPAGQKIVLDGVSGEWPSLEGAAKLEPKNGVELQVSHDRKHVLLLATVPDLSHRPLPHDRLVVKLHWEKPPRASGRFVEWEIGQNSHAQIDGKESVQLHAAVRHDLLAGETTYECAIPLSSIPSNYQGLSLSAQVWDESATDKPIAEWTEQPISLNEFTKAQEEAGRILNNTDFDTLTPEQAHDLLTHTIPSVGNTSSGFRAFREALNRTDYSDVDKAKTIARFLHQHPDNPNANGIILMLFRSRLGTLGWPKSLNVVKAVSQSAKVPREQVYQGLRGHYIGKPELVLRGWKVIGPFPYDEDATQRNSTLPPSLKKITLQERYTIDNQTITWRPIQYTEEHFCDIRKSLATEGHGKAYAVTWVNSAKTQLAAMEFFSQSPTQVWINGRSVRVSIQSKDEIPIYLNAGWNQILVENESVSTGKNADAESWQFKLLLLHPLGMGEVPDMQMMAD